MTRPMWSRTATILAAGLICAGPALTTATASRAAGQRPQTPGIAEARAMATAAPGSNLLANGGAEAGAVAGQGWDSVAIPGWHVRRGLPAVVRYGTRGFPGRADAGPRGRGRQLFAGGAGGTAELTQRIPLRTAAGQAAPSGSRFRISAWLGGTRTAVAELRVRFFSAAGRPLGRVRVGPVGDSGSARHPDFAWRQRSGLLPAGARSAEVRFVLATSLTNDDGPDAPVPVCRSLFCRRSVRSPVDMRTLYRSCHDLSRSFRPT